MKSLADLLREDGAVTDDIYEACGNHYKLNSLGELYGAHLAFDQADLAYIPADGWKRITTRKPRVVEFEDKVECQILGNYCDGEPLKDFEGKRVHVTVREVVE